MLITKVLSLLFLIISGISFILYSHKSWTNERTAHPSALSCWGVIMITSVLTLGYAVLGDLGIFEPNTQVVSSTVTAAIFAILGSILVYHAAKGQSLGPGTSFQLRLKTKIFGVLLCFIATLACLSDAVRQFWRFSAVFLYR